MRYFSLYLPHKRTARGGAAAVEFALVLPLLFALFLVAVDFARVYCYSQIITDAARMGAIYLSNPDLSDKSPYESVDAAVMACVGDLSPPPTVTKRSGVDGRGNRYYEVTVSYQFSLICHAFGAPQTMPLKTSAQARMYPAAVMELGS